MTTRHELKNEPFQWKMKSGKPIKIIPESVLSYAYVSLHKLVTKHFIKNAI